jgi:hypothetical protein
MLCLADKASLKWKKVVGVRRLEIFKEIGALVGVKNRLAKRKKRTPLLEFQIKSIDAHIRKIEQEERKLPPIAEPADIHRASRNLREAANKYVRAVRKAELAKIACAGHVN